MSTIGLGCKMKTKAALSTPRLVVQDQIQMQHYVFSMQDQEKIKAVNRFFMGLLLRTFPHKTMDMMMSSSDKHKCIDALYSPILLHLG